MFEQVRVLLPSGLSDSFASQKKDVVQIDSPIGTREIPLVIHRSRESGIIIINYPGFEGSIDGYNNKYETLANHIAGTCGLGTVVRMGNHFEPRLEYAHSVIDDLAAVIGKCRENSKQWARTSNPDIYLMGFSAGASAVAAIAGEFPEVKKILLIGPSGDADWARIEKSLGKYTGDLCAAVGSHDIVVGPEAAEKFSSLAPNASKRRTFTIPMCDHQFKGENNGLILSTLPLVAFSDRLPVPDPKFGIKLY